jgi:hypothetical protein
MKTIFFTLVLSLMMISCGDKAKKETMPTETTTSAEPEAVTNQTLTVKDTISLATFNAWKSAWASNSGTMPAAALPIAFTMPKIDLSQALAQVGIDSARFYIGLDMTTTPNKLHLMLCGVDSLGKNMLDYSKAQYVYDYTLACPPRCGGVK